MGAETDLNAAGRRWLSPLPLWTGILAGPVAWGLDLETSYALVHWSCSTQRADVLHVISVLALLITAGGAAVSWLARQHAGRASLGHDAERARARFMTMLGLSTSLLFAVAIIASSIPRWVLDACQ